MTPSSYLQQILLKGHMINTLWLSGVDKDILYSVLSWLQQISRRAIIASVRFVHPFYHLVERPQVSCCHFLLLNGFNCPDDLDQKTITKGKSGTGNYCLHRQIEHTWMELAPFNSGKITCAASDGCRDEGMSMKYVPKMLVCP